MQKTVAAEHMYQYYKANKATLPANISSQREFIIDSLSAGQDIATVFSLAAQSADSLAQQTWRKPKKRKK